MPISLLRQNSFFRIVMITEHFFAHTWDCLSAGLSDTTKILLMTMKNARMRDNTVLRCFKRQILIKKAPALIQQMRLKVEYIQMASDTMRTIRNINCKASVNPQ